MKEQNVDDNLQSFECEAQADTFSNSTRRGLSGNTLKYLAIIAMTIDHVAVGFIDKSAALYVIMRFIGRLTIPTMCYFLVEGFYNTRSLRKYLIRLFVFGALSYVPYVLYFYTLDAFKINFILELFISLALLAAIKSNVKAVPKIAILVILVAVAITTDSYLTVFLVILIYLAKRERICALAIIVYGACILLSQALSSGFDSVFIINLGIIVAASVPLLYSGKRGRANVKYLFYAYYPLHLLILFLVSSFI